MSSPGFPDYANCQPVFINLFTFILQRKSRGPPLTVFRKTPYNCLPGVIFIGLSVYLRAARFPFLPSSLFPVPDPQ
jgi:hypothetical protein